MTAPRRIVRNPLVMDGRPCLEGTRIPTRAVWEWHRSGEASDEIARCVYPRLSVADVEAAIRYERSWHRRLGRWVGRWRCRVGAWLCGECV